MLVRVLISLCLAFAAPIAIANTFQENGGVIVFEAESVSATGSWSFQSSIPGYKGSGYYLWTGSDNFAVSNAPRGNPITYTFNVTNPGNYQLRWRSRITKGNNSTEHNDNWVRFPSGQNISGQHPLNGNWTKVYMNELNKWSWRSATVDHVGRPITQYFGAGQHTMQISGRSNGHAIDRIVLYQYEDVSFSEAKFDNLSESSRSGAITPTPEPTPEPAPEPTPEPTPEPDPVTIQILQTNREHPANTCVGTTASLTPTRDIHLSGTTVVNDSVLTVGSNEQYAYLLFNLVDVPATTADYALQMFTEQTNDSTAVSAYQGSSSDWSESSSFEQLPYQAVRLGEETLTFNTPGYQLIHLQRDMLSQGPETIIVAVGNNSSNVLFRSTETDFEPRLKISGTGDFCNQYTQSRESRLAAEAAAPEPNPSDTTDSTNSNDDAPSQSDENGTSDTSADDNNTSNDAQSPEEDVPPADDDPNTDNPFEVTDPNAESSTNESTSGGSSGGAPNVSLLLLIGVAAWTRRRLLRSSC